MPKYEEEDGETYTFKFENLDDYNQVNDFLSEKLITNDITYYENFNQNDDFDWMSQTSSTKFQLIVTSCLRQITYKYKQNKTKYQTIHYLLDDRKDYLFIGSRGKVKETL